MTNAHFVNHTHWDREWYFTSEDAQVLSDQLFSDVLNELEEHPEANFTLDGQTSIVDEYIQIHPEDLNRIKRLVAREQLFIGPWYTQTDALIPDSESIIRNLVIGINDTKSKYGNPMMIGYLPDTFGFSAQLPMLLNQVGINNFINWRGTNFKRQMNSPYFTWKSLGTNKVNSANFPLGYYTGQIALDSKKNLKEFVERRLDEGIKFESKNGNNDTVLIPSGIDQMNIIHNVSKTLEIVNDYSKNNIFISSYPAFMETLKDKKLPEYQGELRYPTYSRVHRTIGSVRSRIKRNNFKLEQIILRRVEPLMVIAKKCGINVSNGVVLKLWKKLLECQPHDTLGGSVSDNVAEDIDHRFKEGFEIAEGIENYIKKRIAQRLHLDNNQVLVFNTDANSFDGYKDILVIAPSKNIKFDDKYQATIINAEHIKKRDNIMQQTAKGFEFKEEPEYFKLIIRLKMKFNGLGYKVVKFDDSIKEMDSLTEINSKTIENDLWKISYTGVGFDAKQNNEEYNNIISILDSGNDGDTYDYSPLCGDKEIELPLIGELIVTEANGTKQMTLTGEWELPETLEDRVSDAPKLIKVPYELTLSLLGQSTVLNGKLTVNNTIYNHRLRLRINTDINSDSLLTQIHGGFRRTKNLPIDDNWEEEFVEKPVNIYNFDKIIGMHDSQKGIFLIAKGMKECELVDNAFCVTLMATTGQLGKPNLLWRPGRASGDTTSIGHQMTPTPMAEELGENTFEFGLVGQVKIDENKLGLIADNWLSPSVGYQLQKINLFINRLDNKIWDIEFADNLPLITNDETFMKIESSVSITAIYPAYTIENSVVLRLSNQSNTSVDITTLLDEGYMVSNALEEIATNQKKIVIEPYSMITLIKSSGNKSRESLV